MLVNKYRTDGNVAYISLTQGQETMIDIADLEKALRLRWHAYRGQSGAYHAHARGVDGKAISMHRFLLDASQGEHIIHDNGNTLDNQRANLLRTPDTQRRVSNKRGRGKTTNSFRIDGDVAYISLSRGQETVIDASDLEKVLEYHWHAVPNMMGGYYASAGVNKTTIYLHRILLNAPRGMYVDHRGHDTLNNRRSNLKLCTNQENNENRDGAFSTSKTGIRGVSIHKCKPTGLMYVFRCHCVTCKVAKYFPYTDEGLEVARVFAEAHYAAMKGRDGS